MSKELDVPVSQILMANMEKTKLAKIVQEANEEAREIEVSDLKTIRWIGEKTLQILIDNWINSVAKLKSMEKEEIERLIQSPITRNQIFSHIKQAG